MTCVINVAFWCKMAAIPHLAGLHINTSANCFSAQKNVIPLPFSLHMECFYVRAKVCVTKLETSNLSKKNPGNGGIFITCLFG